MTSTQITALYRYPVKGFSPEPLQQAEIAAGGTMPHDRAYAIENGPTGFDADRPRYYPKARFLMLMRDERMATFRTRFDEATGVLRIFADGELAVEASLRTAEGRQAIEAWLAEAFHAELRGPPKILAAPSHSFSDKAAKVLHLVNLASVRALEERLGRRIDPLRFRPNIVIDGAPPFAELGWEGHELRLGTLTLEFESRTGRCAATNVDPQTGRRDMDMPRALEALYGHADFGIYLKAKTAGSIAVGDAVEAVASAILQL
ncbi:MAG TPA: MOSC domain-containing protein [Afifellaceae bacterium]|nr:MOSC domain-containing protein [Afifellaceae bacterium]